MPNPKVKRLGDWTIRRREAKVAMMIDYASVSTTERVWVSYDGLINLKMLKIQSGPFGNIGGKPGVGLTKA